MNKTTNLNDFIEELETIFLRNTSNAQIANPAPYPETRTRPCMDCGKDVILKIDKAFGGYFGECVCGNDAKYEDYNENCRIDVWLDSKGKGLKK